MTNKEALTKLRMAHLETEDNDLKEALLMGIRAIKQLKDIFPERCLNCVTEKGEKK